MRNIRGKKSYVVWGTVKYAYRYIKYILFNKKRQGKSKVQIQTIKIDEKVLEILFMGSGTNERDIVLITIFMIFQMWFILYRISESHTTGMKRVLYGCWINL